MDSDVGLEKRILKNLYIPPPHCAQGCIFLLVVLGLSWTYISLSRHFKRKKLIILFPNTKILLTIMILQHRTQNILPL